MFGHLNLSFGQHIDDRFFQCSLCHALGREYGPLARLLTNYDTILLLTLPLSIAENAIISEQCRCPLMKTERVASPVHPLMRYCAAVTVFLISEKIKDDLYDHDRFFPAVILKWVNRKRGRAEVVFEALGFDIDFITTAFDRHRLLEKDNGVYLKELTEPTASVMAEIYGYTAHLIGKASLEPAFRQIGRSLGKSIYLLDCLCDREADRAKGAFNPLSRCLSSACGHPETRPYENIQPSQEAVKLLRLAYQEIVSAVKSLPEQPYITDLLISRLAEKMAPFFNESVPVSSPLPYSLLERLKLNTPLSILLSSSPAIASSSAQNVGGRCCESMISILIMLFILQWIFRSCFGCRPKRPDEITVDQGCCSGTKTYRRDPCTGKYRDKNQCC